MRLIDADALWMVTEGDHDYYERFEIENAPTIDAEPVVRCGECRYYRNGGCLTGRYDLKDNDFCSLGERKDD